MTLAPFQAHHVKVVTSLMHSEMDLIELINGRCCVLYMVLITKSVDKGSSLLDPATLEKVGRATTNSASEKIQ